MSHSQKLLFTGEAPGEHDPLAPAGETIDEMSLDAAAVFAGELERLAGRPTEDEMTEELDEIARSASQRLRDRA